MYTYTYIYIYIYTHTHTHIYIHIYIYTHAHTFFFFGQHWGLNSGPHTCSFFVMGFFEIGSQTISLGLASNYDFPVLCLLSSFKKNLMNF
jgi:hypothetical protein